MNAAEDSPPGGQAIQLPRTWLLHALRILSAAGLIAFSGPNSVWWCLSLALWLPLCLRGILLSIPLLLAGFLAFTAAGGADAAQADWISNPLAYCLVPGLPTALSLISFGWAGQRLRALFTEPRISG